MDQVVYQGAEAKIYFIDHQGMPAVRKERFAKGYRHPELDKKLTKTRTKAEVKALQNLKSKCPQLSNHIPTIFHSSFNEIIMQRLDGFRTLHDALVEGRNDSELVKRLLNKTGNVIASVHKSGLIHGDLTATNFMINQDEIIVPIDFGLSSFSTTAEDRAVDLYVMERSLLTTGLESGNVFDIITASYATDMESAGEIVMKKLSEVQARGRKRDMTG